MKRCLICEKELNDFDCGNNVEDAGQLTASFEYGSSFDWLGYRGGPKENLQGAHRVASCHEIVAYICDHCFVKKHHLFEGYNFEDKLVVAHEQDADGTWRLRRHSQSVCIREHGREGGVRYGILCEKKLVVGSDHGRPEADVVAESQSVVQEEGTGADAAEA